METNKLVQVLEEYGLAEHQAKIYLALLELGNASAIEIARKSGVERAHAYYLLEQLIRLGLVSRSSRGKTATFVANNPKNLIAGVEQKLTNLKDSLPEMVALYQKEGVRPRVQIFEGKKGLAQILEDMLDTMEKLPPEKKEILEYVSPDSALAAMEKEQKEFVRRRIAQGTKIRWITPDTSIARIALKEAPGFNREMRLISPDRFKAQTEFNIYGNKINFIGSKGEEIGVIIEHTEITKTMREFFELAWEGAKKYNERATKKIK